jgi:hypothetical protein
LGKDEKRAVREKKVSLGKLQNRQKKLPLTVFLICRRMGNIVP